MLLSDQREEPDHGRPTCTRCDSHGRRLSHTTMRQPSARRHLSRSPVLTRLRRKRADLTYNLRQRFQNGYRGGSERSTSSIRQQLPVWSLSGDRIGMQSGTAVSLPQTAANPLRHHGTGTGIIPLASHSTARLHHQPADESQPTRMQTHDAGRQTAGGERCASLSEEQGFTRTIVPSEYRRTLTIRKLGKC